MKTVQELQREVDRLKGELDVALAEAKRWNLAWHKQWLATGRAAWMQP